MSSSSETGRRGSDTAMVLLAVLLIVLIGVGLLAGVFVFRRVQQAEGTAREMAIEAQRQRTAAESASKEAMQKAMEEEEKSRLLEAPTAPVAPPAPNLDKFIDELVGSGGAQVVGDPATIPVLLDAAAKRLDQGALRSSPLSEASARSSIGLTYLGLGRFDNAELHLRLAVELRRRVHGDDHAEVAREMANLKKCLDRRPPQ